MVLRIFGCKTSFHYFFKAFPPPPRPQDSHVHVWTPRGGVQYCIFDTKFPNIINLVRSLSKWEALAAQAWWPKFRSWGHIVRGADWFLKVTLRPLWSLTWFPPSLPPSSSSGAHIKSNDIRKENLIVKVTYFLPVPVFGSFLFLKYFSEALCPRESVLVCIMYVCTMPGGHYSVVLWSHNSWASSYHCSRHTHLMTRYTSNFTACRVCCFLWRVLGGDAADSKLFIEWQLRKLSRIIVHERL